jgi:hypothetical protein
MMPLAGLTAAGLAPAAVAEFTDRFLWLLTGATGLGIVVLAVITALGTRESRDLVLYVTTTVTGALLVISTGLA